MKTILYLLGFAILYYGFKKLNKNLKITQKKIGLLLFYALAVLIVWNYGENTLLYTRIVLSIALLYPVYHQAKKLK